MTAVGAAALWPVIRLGGAAVLEMSQYARYVLAMDTVMTIEEAEARLTELVSRVEQGETIVVTRDGKPVLDLVPHKRKGGFDREGLAAFKRARGLDRIVTYVAPDFDDPLPEDYLITPEVDPADKPPARG